MRDPSVRPSAARPGGALQTYLLVERPETEITTLFVVAKGPNRGAKATTMSTPRPPTSIRPVVFA